jgi:DNA-binding CsgD family transcriptional regulator
VSVFAYTYYATLVLIAGIAVAFAYDLQKKYPFKYLSDFFYYLIAISFYWFTVLIVPDLLVSILGGEFEARSETVIWLFVLFSEPCILIALYLFIALFIHLRQERIPGWVKVTFLVAASTFGIGLGFAVKFSLDSTNHEIVRYFYLIMRAFSLCLRLTAIAYAFLGALKSADKLKRKLTLILCVYYFTVFVIYSVFFEYIPMSEDVLLYLNPSIYLFINFPPLFIFGKYAKMIFKDRLIAQEDRVNFDRIFHKYGLSKREQEIFILMLEGKSNKEIGETLFISVKTVKNHIYNIFQKLGVNSRIKLYVFIRNLANN